MLGESSSSTDKINKSDDMEKRNYLEQQHGVTKWSTLIRTTIKKF